MRWRLRGRLRISTLVNFDIGMLPGRSILKTSARWAVWPRETMEPSRIAPLSAGSATRKRRTVGGLVGTNEGSIINCYFDGWVGASWEVGDIEEENIHPCVGGLVGLNDGSDRQQLSPGASWWVTKGIGGLVGDNSRNNQYVLSRHAWSLGATGAGGLSVHQLGLSSQVLCERAGHGPELRGGPGVGMAGRYAGERHELPAGTSANTDCVRSGAGIGSHGYSDRRMTWPSTAGPAIRTG